MTAHRPRIFAVGGWRYEPEWLVDEFRENLAWVDELVIVDDRARTGELWVHEGDYRLMQRQALIDAGIRPWDWVLVTSPDERWGSRAKRVVRGLITKRHRRIFQFPLREMFTLTSYRTDGIWGDKWRPRLFPFLPDQEFTKGSIQTPPSPVEGGYERVRVPHVPIYHLENIAPASRIERAIVYEALSPGSQQRAARSAFWRRHDPTGRYIRAYGYAYLADTRGMRLAPVPVGDIVPRPTRPYHFRVPDELLVAECGQNREELTRWFHTTLARGPERFRRRRVR
ncbi:glycosyltransferase family protein [Streptomyces halobius]|uniref:Uncharacterized protein n=1 Tax=Streptomyces halobius TaxID=2879846 RepID=A0ABY4MD30_9ACTN|nr:hypothetical protein [Streptomyces halobius]UQA95618.1 hypothetical protein K9S39_30520 [Streptomyces halobius]